MQVDGFHGCFVAQKNKYRGSTKLLQPINQLTSAKTRPRPFNREPPESELAPSGGMKRVALQKNFARGSRRGGQARISISTFVKFEGEYRAALREVWRYGGPVSPLGPIDFLISAPFSRPID